MTFPQDYVRAGAAYATLEQPVPAPYLRRSFFIRESVACARLLIGCAGYYEVHLNGADITKGAMAPYRSNPDHLVYFDCYEVTDRLIPGKNTLAFLLGNGIQNGFGGFIWDFDKVPWRGAPQMTFSLSVTYADGTSETIEPAGQVRTAPSPILCDDVHYGEYYDARLEIPGWDLPEFDDRSWKLAEPAPTPRGEARLCEAEPIRFQESLKPVDIFPCGNGYIYDFGLNGAGLCRLTIDGTPGQKLLLRYFEQVHDGKPYLDHIRFRNETWNFDMRYQEDEYTCAGNGTEHHIPRFTYHGFRYVYVEGITPQQATPELLTCLILHSDIPTIGHFHCSDPTINAIQEATVRSDRTNFHYFPTDCPQREKNGWTADAALSAAQILLNLDAGVSFREWMRNIYKALDESGNLPGIVPSGKWGYGTGPAWDCVLVYMPYYTYLYRGDRKILEELAVPLMRYLTFLYQRRTDSGLLDFGLGDWCQTGRSPDAPETPRAYTSTVFAMDIARKAAFIYDVLNLPAQRDYAQRLADELAQAIRQTYLDTRQDTTQTAIALALYHHLYTPEETTDAVQRLVWNIHENHDHMNVGVLGARVLFRVLAAHDQADLAYQMVTQTDRHSYGNWIARGATTLWETFHEKELYGSSMNHHFWGDISAWFYCDLAGLQINPTGRDVTQVDIAPHFVEKLSFAQASYQLPAGEIAVRWERQAEAVILTVHKADALHGTLILPTGFKLETGDTRISLSSGSYRILPR